MPGALPEGVVQTSVSAAVLRAARRLTTVLEAELHAEGLGIDHWLAIDTLASSNGLTMAELQSSTLTAGPTLTRVVDRLVSHSLAYREVDAEDRRKVRVYLAKRGSDVRRRLTAGIAAAETEWAVRDGRELRQSITRALGPS